MPTSHCIHIRISQSLPATEKVERLGFRLTPQVSLYVYIALTCTVYYTVSVQYTILLVTSCPNDAVLGYLSSYLVITALIGMVPCHPLKSGFQPSVGVLVSASIWLYPGGRCTLWPTCS